MTRFIAMLALAGVLAACGGGSSGSSAGALQPASSSFLFVSALPVSDADCPQTTGQTFEWCQSNWPPDRSGTVYRYAYTETRLATGSKMARLAYVYKPATITDPGSYPMLVDLHGGTQTGDALFEQVPFAQLADGRSQDNPIQWPRNTPDCQFSAYGSSSLGLGGPTMSGFVSTDGTAQDCTPDVETFAKPSAALPFYVVYPDGIFDFSGGGRSWEDGRNPSPGQVGSVNPDEQKRDDVGFINQLIATIKQQEGARIDSTRVYLAGVSNGGIMAARLLCNADNSAYPELASLAAVSVSVASMADNIASGSNGREQCPSKGQALTPLAIFVGYDAPTPNSAGQPFFTNCNPYNPIDPIAPDEPACPYATVSGDGTMPYGTAFDTGGGTFTVNSLTIGNVIASFDHQNFWLNYLSGSGAGGSTASSGMYGYFTHYRHYSFANSPLIYQVYETQNGLHLSAGTRFDFSAAARIYDFLFSFSKVQGKPQYIGGAYDPASGTYGNLTGVY